MLHGAPTADCVGLLNRDERLLRPPRSPTCRVSGSPVWLPVGRGASRTSCRWRFDITRTRTQFDVGGHRFAQRKKYRDVQRNPRIAIVVDDLATVDPWRPRMIEIRGEADILPTGGEAIGPGFDPPIFRIRPRRIVSIGIDGDEPFSSNARSVS